MAEIILYSKNPCPYCVNAKHLLDEKGVAYKVIDLTDKPDEIQAIKESTGWRTVPIIMINGKLVGGYSDMKALDETGELDQMLKD